MDFSTIYDWLLYISPYTPALVFLATVLDIFFITGFLLYGAAMLSAVLMLLMTGMISAETLLYTAFAGSVTGNCINFAIGRWCSETDFIKRTLANPRLQKAERFLTHRGLLPFMIIGRFITFTRPVYALFLGSLGVSFQTFIVRELPLTFFWVSFWLVLLLQGESIIAKLI